MCINLEILLLKLYKFHLWNAKYERSKLAYIGHASKEAHIAQAGTFVDKKNKKELVFLRT